MSRIRVLVVDDSALMRKIIPQLLSMDHDIDVVGTAMDGLFALKKIEQFNPDVITLDVDMPRLDGVETLRRIVEQYGIPTILVSSLTGKNAEVTLRALEIGAFDFVTKPQAAVSVHIKEIGGDLIRKIKAAAANPLSRQKIKKIRPVPATGTDKKLAVKSPADRVLAIGASTGGPNALSYLLPRLPKEFPAAIVIVQHMPPGFTEMFALRLNALCRMEVKEAADGDLVAPGRILIAPGDKHLKVKRLPLGAVSVLSDASPVSGHKPSADVLFRSVADEYGGSATGLIMTGMGTDGAEGIGEIKTKGGITIAQNEESCVVYGMPKAAVERGHIVTVVSLEEMGDFLVRQFEEKEALYGTA